MTDALVIKHVYLVIVGLSTVVVIAVFIIVILVVPVNRPPVCLHSYRVFRYIWFPSSVYASVDISRTYLCGDL